MLTQGFRNFIKASSFADQSFQQLLKKSDEYRRSSKMSLDYMQNIYKHFESYQAGFEKLFLDPGSQNSERQEKNQIYYRQFFTIFQSAFNIQNGFARKYGNNIKQAIQLSSNLFKNYSNLILAFQSLIRLYVKNQQILMEQGKRYFKNQKAVLQNLVLYKTSFTDVKLIYNMDQRIKRYITCENSYKSMLQDLKVIQEKIILANNLKKQITQNYANIQYQFISALKIVGNRIITLAELFVFEYKSMFYTLSTILREKSSETIKFKAPSIFHLDEQTNQESFPVQVGKENNKKYPNFIVYLATAKPQFYPQVIRLFNKFLKQVAQNIQRRKKSEKSLFEFICNYFKLYEKLVLTSLKDINSSYQKNKKKISQIYGSQHMFFMKTFSIIFEKVIENGEILNKSVSLRLKTIENIIQQSSRCMDSFLKDSKACLQKHIKKKQNKKGQQEDNTVQIQQLRLQIHDKSVNMQGIFDSLVLKLNQNEIQLNVHCNAIINDMFGNSLQLHQICKQFHEDEFDQEFFLKKYQIFQSQVDEIIRTKITLFNDLSFAQLRSEKDQIISFESELNKVQEFKKIKKPTDYQNQKQGIKRKESVEDKFNDLEKKWIETPKKSPLQEGSEKSPQKFSERSQKVQKYEQFLLSKIAYLEGQQFVKSYACGLSDKIILTGRLFVTTQRLCFHSKFNPNNVFFGDTFIQIPKKDIIKIEKRQNAIIFNNSISVTTVNGEMFFTSFFARNQAYDSILQALQINNNEELMFEPLDVDLVGNFEVEEVEQDDLKQEKIAERTSQIDEIIQAFDYNQIHVSEYTFTGLNALKFFKLFDSSSQLTYNRKTFKGFNMYFKEQLQHKDIVVDEWIPNIHSFLNSINIKQNTPILCQRKSNSIIPVTNSGIPLMPKQSHLHEACKLHFYSKDKYVMITKIENRGIPYCDYFNIRYKKVIETIAENKCRLTVYYYIEFVQKTMMQSVIKSKSFEESKIAAIRQEIEMKKYLKYIEKMQGKANSHEVSKENLEERVKQLQKQLQQSEECEQKLQNNAIIDKQIIKKNKKWLLYSLFLNVLLIIIIISLI